MTHPFPPLEAIMAYEAGELGEDAMIELFAQLVRSGLCWCLQGSYGRTAEALIHAGIIDRSGHRLDRAELVTVE